MLEEVLRQCNRLRPDDTFVRHISAGTFEIANGAITPPPADAGLYVYIVGSAANDGLHALPDEAMTDEVFRGAVWALAIPPAFVALANEMGEWQKNYGKVVASPFTSENFGGYSYTKPANANTDSGMTVWSAYKTRLNKWRVL